MSTRPQDTKLEDRDYLRFRDLILERSGLFFPEKKRTDLEIGLAKAISEANSESDIAYNLDQYYRLLRDRRNPIGLAEMDRLINGLTVGETHFFRNQAQFDALYYQVLPALIDRKRAAAAAIGPGISPQLRIWSAGCATGEEPYSLAILLKELIPDIENWSVLILATDINQNSLIQANKATYSGWSFREPRAKMLRERYFIWDQKIRRYRLRTDALPMVTFAPLNLVEDHYPAIHNNTVSMDLLFCRNVTIYFNEENTRKIVDHFYHCLVNGGWLIVGHSEPSLSIYQAYQIVNFSGVVLYKKEGLVTAEPHNWARLDEASKEKYISLSHPDAHAIRKEQTDGVPHLSDSATIGIAIEQSDDSKGDWGYRPGEVLLSAPPEGQIINQPYNEGTQLSKDLKEIDPCEVAGQLLNEGKAEQAIKTLKSKLSAIPDSALAHSLLGRAFANLGNWDEARRWCIRALRLDALNAETHYILALVYDHEDEIELAIDSLKKAIYLERNGPLYHLNLAMLYKKTGQVALAERSLRNTIRILEKWPVDNIISNTGGANAKHLSDIAERILSDFKNKGEEE